MTTNLAKPHRISVIAAVGRRRELGKDNALIWAIPDDLKHFRTITSGHPVIMGLNTYKSIGRPLPNRTNIVVNHLPEPIEGVVVVASPEEALQVAEKSPGNEEIFIMGGAQIYTTMLKYADRFYLTLIDAEAEADAFFPDYSMFTKKISEEKKDHNGLSYSFVVLEK